MLAIRLAAGLVLFYFGSQKFFGWFGGPGFSATLQAFHKMMGAPAWLGSMAIVSECLGGLALCLGILTRLAAAGACCTMVVATYVEARKITSLVATPENMFPIKDAALPLMLMVACLALLLVGPGSYSLDQKLFGRRK